MKLTFQKNKLIILSFVISLIVVFYRRPDSFYHPQFWGEEGTVFFQEAYYFGFKSLFNTFAGYFHLVPRLICCSTVFFHLPLEIIPIIFCYSWLLILVLIMWYVWKRLPLDNLNKFFVSISIVLIPLQSEVFMNQTNAQWILALFPLIIFSSVDPEKNKNWFYVDIIVLILSGLTGPNFTVLLPLFIILIWFQKNNLTLDKRRFMLYIIAITCGIISAVSLCKHGTVNRVDGEFIILNKGFVQYIFVQYFFLFMGKVAFKLPFMIMLIGVIGVFVIFFMALKQWIRNKKNNFIVICVFMGLLFLLTTMMAYRNEPSLLSPYYRGVRNFYIPALTFVWVLIELISLTKYKVVLLSAMMVLFSIELVLFVGQFKFDNFNIKYYSNKIKTTDTLSIPINPAGWHIFIDNRKTKIQ